MGVCTLVIVPGDVLQYPVPPSAELWGRTDQYIGTWLKDRRREDVVLATKVCKFLAVELPPPSETDGAPGAYQGNFVWLPCRRSRGTARATSSVATTTT
jgi:hypothetical protein